MQNDTENTMKSEVIEKDSATFLENFQRGQAPLKLVTGSQTTSNLSFDIKPGAIVAHEGSTVIFVCG